MNFLSWVNFRNQQQGGPIRTFLREPMGEHITKSQSQRRCHCYGPVRAPALWFLGGSHREVFGGGPSGADPRPAALVSGLVPILHYLGSRVAPSGARAGRRRGRLGAWAQPQPPPPPRARWGREMQPPGPPPAYSPTNGDFTFVSSADAEGETEPREGTSPWGTPGGRGSVFLGPRRLWPGGDGQEADPWGTRALCSRRAFREARVVEGGVWGTFQMTRSVSGFRYTVWWQVFLANLPTSRAPTGPQDFISKVTWHCSERDG